MNEKWIFFDLGGTLIDETLCWKKRIYLALIKLDGKVSYHKFFKELKKNSLDGSHFWTKTLAHFGIENEKKWWDSTQETLFKGVVDVLNYLKNKGYKLGIIANQLPGLDDRLKDHKIFNYFDVIVGSGDFGVKKPNLEIYKEALKRSNAKPEDSFMVGDRIDKDMIPAHELGFKTVFVRQSFARYQKLNDERKSLINYQIKNIRKLVKIL